jgi:hypothetical protein
MNLNSRRIGSPGVLLFVDDSCVEWISYKVMLRKAALKRRTPRRWRDCQSPSQTFARSWSAALQRRFPAFSNAEALENIEC